MPWEIRQCIRTRSTNFQITMAEEGNYLTTGRFDYVSKIGYEYIHQWCPVQKIDRLPCIESFTKAYTPTSQMYEFQGLRRLTICGMAALIVSWNSTTHSTSTMFGKRLDVLPCSESFNNASVLALRTSSSLCQRRSMIPGMASLTNSRNLVSSKIVISNVQVRRLYSLPCSESLFNTFASTLIMFLRKPTICGTVAPCLLETTRK